MTTNPAPLILIQPLDGSIALNAYGMTAPEILAALRRSLVHLVADAAGCVTIPSPAAIAANGHGNHSGHGLAPAPDSSRVLVAGDPTPPLRVPRDLAKSSASQPARKKPGPAKGTPRKRREPDDIEAQAQRDTWT